MALLFENNSINDEIKHANNNQLPSLLEKACIKFLEENFADIIAESDFIINISCMNGPVLEGVAWDADNDFYNIHGIRLSRLMNIGKNLYNEKKYKQSLKAYQDALKLVPELKTLASKIPSSDKDDEKKYKKFYKELKKDQKYSDGINSIATIGRDYNLRWIKINEDIIKENIGKLIDLAKYS